MLREGYAHAMLIQPRAALLLALFFLTTGCASKSVSIPSWQQSLTQYVRGDAHGDPTALRDVTLADGRPGFSVIGHHDVSESTDANGVLLGHEQAGGRMWFVYLVGLVEKQKVKDIQLAAFSVERGKFTWKHGKGSKQSLDAYRAQGLKLARERFPDRKDPPSQYTNFPKPDDVFKMTKSDGGSVVATHEASGAHWELMLGGLKK
jgi:hypothetical protein